MRKAARRSDVTRRSIVAAVASAALGQPGPVAPIPPASGGAGDPAFAAIAAHHTALAAFNAAARHLCNVEEGRVEDNGVDRGNTAADDPILTAAAAAFDAASDAEQSTAWALANHRPAHSAAIAALLRYVADVEAQGHAWPEPQTGDDVRDASWAVTFHRNLAAALDAIS